MKGLHKKALRIEIYWLIDGSWERVSTSKQTPLKRKSYGVGRCYFVILLFDSFFFFALGS